jgi:hypothetical protein
MAVSIEEGIFFFWVNQQPLFATPVSTVDTWTHFAVVRSAGIVRVYLNGALIGTPLTPASPNMIDTIHNLVIGNESIPGPESGFTGYLTNFRIVKGTAVYLNNFTRPSAPLQPITGTVLLLSALNPASINVDSSSSRKSVINTNVTWSGVSTFSS